MIKPGDLNRKQREMFDTWRSLGLSESAAMDALREDGLLPTASDHDRLVASFISLGLSASEATIAADGRDGRSRRPVGRSTSAASVAEETVEGRALVNTVRALADGALRRGKVSPRISETRELAAVREAAWKLIIRLPPTTAATAWAARVITEAFPGVQLVDPPRSSGSSKRGSVSNSLTKTVGG